MAALMSRPAPSVKRRRSRLADAGPRNGRGPERLRIARAQIGAHGRPRAGREEDGMSSSETTTDHDTIREWTEARGGRPSLVRTAGGKGKKNSDDILG